MDLVNARLEIDQGPECGFVVTLGSFGSGKGIERLVLVMLLDL